MTTRNAPPRSSHVSLMIRQRVDQGEAPLGPRDLLIGLRHKALVGEHLECDDAVMVCGVEDLIRCRTSGCSRSRTSASCPIHCPRRSRYNSACLRNCSRAESASVHSK